MNDCPNVPENYEISEKCHNELNEAYEHSSKVNSLLIKNSTNKSTYWSNEKRNYKKKLSCAWLQFTAC